MGLIGIIIIIRAIYNAQDPPKAANANICKVNVSPNHWGKMSSWLEPCYDFLIWASMWLYDRTTT